MWPLFAGKRQADFLSSSSSSSSSILLVASVRSDDEDDDPLDFAQGRLDEDDSPGSGRSPTTGGHSRLRLLLDNPETESVESQVTGDIGRDAAILDANSGPVAQSVRAADS